MTSIATNATDDVGSEVSLFRAVKFSMTDLTAVLAGLVLIVTEGTVESGKFTKLVALELVLSFWNGRSL
jgi:hypothetical protein